MKNNYGTKLQKSHYGDRNKKKIWEIWVNGTPFEEISNLQKMMQEFSYFINVLNCFAFVLENGSKVLFCFQWINTNKHF